MKDICSVCAYDACTGNLPNCPKMKSIGRNEDQARVYNTLKRLRFSATIVRNTLGYINVCLKKEIGKDVYIILKKSQSENRELLKVYDDQIRYLKKKLRYYNQTYQKRNEIHRKSRSKHE